MIAQCSECESMVEFGASGRCPACGALAPPSGEGRTHGGWHLYHTSTHVRIPLRADGENHVGRGHLGRDVLATDLQVSGHHCTLIAEAGGVRVFDLSTHGTTIAPRSATGFGARVRLGRRHDGSASHPEGIMLRNGDLLTLAGTQTFCLQAASDVASEDVPHSRSTTPSSSTRDAALGSLVSSPLVTETAASPRASAERHPDGDSSEVPAPTAGRTSEGCRCGFQPEETWFVAKRVAIGGAWRCPECNARNTR